MAHRPGFIEVALQRGQVVGFERFVVNEWLSSPIGFHVAKHSVLNGVPLGGTGEQVGDHNGEAKFISQWHLATTQPKPSRFPVVFFYRWSSTAFFANPPGLAYTLYPLDFLTTSADCWAA
jgi:hypothetical protein